MFKKAAAALMALALAGTLSACGKDIDETVEVTEETTVTETEPTETTTEDITEEETTDSAEEQTTSDSDGSWLDKLLGDEDTTEPTTAPESDISASEDGLYLVPAESSVFSSINTEENPYILSVGVDSQVAAESLRAHESGYSNVMSSDSILGTIIALDSDTNDEITRAVLRFEIKDEYLDNTLGTYAEYEPELQGIRRLNVFMWVEDMNMSLPIETQFDGNKVWCETDQLGTYDITDMELWLAQLNIDPAEFAAAGGQ